MPAVDLEISRVDPFDDESHAAWHAAYLAADIADRSRWACPWSAGEMQMELQQETDAVDRYAYVGRVDGEVVCAAFFGMRLKDNTHRAVLGIFVPPRWRRRGHGRAMLARLEAQARAAGRSVLATEAAWRPELGPDGRGSPGVEFLRHSGFELALGDVMRVLELPMSSGRLAELAAEAAERHAAYEIRCWSGPVPEELIDGWAALDAAVETEAPTGSRDIELEKIDADEYRRSEELYARQGRRPFGAAAIAPDGSVAAYTLLLFSRDDGRAYQAGTLVRREHRGHRLGLAVKAANLRLLQEELPEADAVITYNAGSNAHMVAINDALGFVPVERLGEFEKRLPGHPD